ncbi:hypothetical protein BpHYR1_018359, partial [Brachionus plicatilis]
IIIKKITNFYTGHHLPRSKKPHKDIKFQPSDQIKYSSLSGIIFAKTIYKLNIKPSENNSSLYLFKSIKILFSNVSHFSDSILQFLPLEVLLTQFYHCNSTQITPKKFQIQNMTDLLKYIGLYRGDSILAKINPHHFK